MPCRPHGTAEPSGRPPLGQAVSGKSKLKEIPQHLIHSKVLLIRGQRVMLDRDLALLYEIETFNLNKAVSRNLERFPEDFMFQLSEREYKDLIFQNGISRWGGTRKRPRVFTEHGILMLSSVLKNRRAVLVNIAIMRTFVRLRSMLASNQELSHKLNQLEQRIEKHDHHIKSIFEAIRELLKEPEPPQRRIGFHT